LEDSIILVKNTRVQNAQLYLHKVETSKGNE